MIINSLSLTIFSSLLTSDKKVTVILHFKTNESFEHLAQPVLVILYLKSKIALTRKVCAAWTSIGVLLEGLNGPKSNHALVRFYKGPSIVQ